MKFPTLLAPAALFLPLALSAQQPDWLVGWPVNWNVNPGLPRHVLAASPGGNLMSARLVGPAFAYGTDAMGTFAVERLDPGTGQPLWSCTLGDSMCVDVGAVDDAGNVYVAGRMIGPLAICNGTFLNHSSAVWLDTDHFLMKFDPGGGILWKRNVSLVHPDAFLLEAMTIDPNGDLWYSIGDFSLTHINRVDGAGNDVETRTIDGAKTVGGISFDPWGGLYVSGACDDLSMSFGGVSPVLPVNEPYLMFLLRFKPDGSGDWAHFAHDITFKHPVVVADHTGHAYLAGDLMDSTSWGGIAFNGPDWNSSVFLARVDSTGSFQWGVESDPPGGAITGAFEPARDGGLAVDGSGQVHLAGIVQGQVDWGNGVVSDAISLGARALTVVRFDPSGLPLWATTSDPSTAFPHAMSVTAMDDGTLHFGVHVNSTFSFPPHSLNVANPQGYVVGRISDPSTMVPEGPAPPALIAFPSPFTDGFALSPAPSAQAAVRAYDANGRLVHNGPYRAGLGQDWPAGLYAVEVREGTQRSVVRVVKE